MLTSEWMSEAISLSVPFLILPLFLFLLSHLLVSEVLMVRSLS